MIWGKDLSARQLSILDKLPGYGSSEVFKKRDVSMIDLAALTANTGHEFAMFTRSAERLVIRGNAKRVPLNESNLIKLRDDGYRWSGHTHPGSQLVDLESSDGDKETLRIFNQANSVIYNATGKHRLIYPQE